MEKSLLNKERRFFVQVFIELRTKSGLMQADLARKLKVPQSFISKIETGQRKVDVFELREICIQMGTSLVEFSKLLEKRIKSSKGKN